MSNSDDRNPTVGISTELSTEGPTNSTTSLGSSIENPSFEEQAIHLSRGSGGVSNTNLEAWSPTFPELCELLQQLPPVGEKDGSYFVRGPHILGAPTRSDDNIEYASLVVLDCDSSFDPDTGEITDGAPDPAIVHEILKSLDLSHCLSTTHSHGQEGKGNRYRVVIPAVMNDKGELAGALEWVFHVLVEKGCCLVNVKENRSWSQPWYFPRLASKGSEHLCLDYSSSKVLDVAASLAWYKDQEIAQAETEIVQAAKKPMPRDPKSTYARFNNEHGTPKWILQTLKGNDYKLQSTTLDDNGEPVFRLLSPHSTSGSPGIVVFCGDDGVWRVYSHHGAQEPLSREGDLVQVCDAFDVFRILEHVGDEREALSTWTRDQDSRPVIQISGGQVAHNLTAAIKALADLDPPAVYQRAQSLTRVAHLEETAETAGCTIPAGTAHIVPLQRGVLTVELSKAIRWEAYKKKAWRHVDPCPKVSGALLEAIGMWTGIPTLIGISEAPILRSDGSLLAEPGYDPATMLYVEGRFPAFSIPDKISLDDAKKAAKVLLAPFSEFPFVDTELDEAGLLAYLFTLAVRPQLNTAPLFCISATTPGSGKGLLAEAANLLVRGRDAAIMPPTQGNGGEEETRKRITALLSQGLSSANLDNCTKAIGGESLNALLTATEWTDRILGSSTAVKLPNRITLVATGNNLSVRGDMTRRSLSIQLDAKVERPELREFDEKDLPGQILRDRGALLQALFTILKGYQQAGSPGSDERLLGRFEAWTARVCGPIRWLGYSDPLESQERLREIDPESEKLGALLAAWWEHLGTDWFTVGDVMEAIEAHSNSGGKQASRDTLKTAVNDAAADGRGQVNRKLLGWYLRRNEGRIVEDHRLERKQRGESKSKHAQHYRVVNISLLDDSP